MNDITRIDVRRRRLCLAAGIATALPALTLPRRSEAVDPLRIRLGTLAPKGSSYHRALQEMGEKWRIAQGAGATFTIFADGTQGGEADTVRRMRVGQLNAALLSVIGLLEIDRSVMALQYMPMVYRNWDEVDYVRERLAPMLEARLLEKGFVVLFWGDGGWVRYFSNAPALHPADFRRMKMFVWSGDPQQVEIMKSMNYLPVSIETADILPGLQTGLIDAVPATPFFALAGQFNGPAPYLLDIKWVPIVGACVVTRKAWDAMTAAAREELKRAAVQAGAEIRSRGRVEDLESIDAMKRRGLKVATLTPEIEAEWRRTAEEVYPRIRGTAVPAAIFDEALRLVAEFRTSGQARK
jgi:TRAP-type C4-dicarboxylate transport system substrate-binding protein